jgi:hypothetical protein
VCEPLLLSFSALCTKHHLGLLAFWLWFRVIEELMR